jgi:hypothetical protein
LLLVGDPVGQAWPWQFPPLRGPLLPAEPEGAADTPDVLT